MSLEEKGNIENEGIEKVIGVIDGELDELRDKEKEYRNYDGLDGMGWHHEMYLPVIDQIRFLRQVRYDCLNTQPLNFDLEHNSDEVLSGKKPLAVKTTRNYTSWGGEKELLFINEGRVEMVKYKEMSRVDVNKFKNACFDDELKEFLYD